MVRKKIPKFFRSARIPVQEGEHVAGSYFESQATSGPAQQAALESWGWGLQGEADDRIDSWNSMLLKAHLEVEGQTGSALLSKMDDLFDLFFAQRVVSTGELGSRAMHLRASFLLIALPPT